MTVYCNKCKYLKETHSEDKPTEVECKAPGNTKKKDTPMGPVDVLLKTPAELNKDNDCKLYAAQRPAPEVQERGPEVGLKTISDHEKRITALERKAAKKPKPKPKP